MVFRKSRQKRSAHSGVRLESLSPTKSNSKSRNRLENTDGGDGGSVSDTASRAVIAELEARFSYDEVPDEVLVGHDIDLSIWSVVLRDSCLQRLGGNQPSNSNPSKPNRSQVISASSNQLTDVIESAGMRLITPSSAILRLNIAGAENISDQALVTIARLCPHLKSLNVEKAVQLTDRGFRHLVSHCPMLQSLNMNHIPGVQGVTLTTIAELQLPLKELLVAGCTNVPEFAFQRFVQTCGTRLERLDISFCSTAATDNLLLVIGQSCPRLRDLRLRGCRQISDTGVVNITTRCADLTVLDLARFDFQYKINDVALLSLGERCQLLRHLTLSGCDMLTDVGMSWLTSGCTAITHLDLTGCVKITDVGVRSIGESLLQLVHISLRNCSRISDLGVRHLARGCPELLFIDLSGLGLLSDAHSDNSHALAELRLGVGALVHSCRRLRHLDLTRCKSIGDGTMNQISQQCRELAVLHLAGCDRITNKGVQSVVRQCVTLSSLTLSDCYRIDDVAFALQSNTVSPSQVTTPQPLALLTSLRLRNCMGVTDSTLRGLGRTTRRLYLRELDLSGCSRITDLGILALTESTSLSTSLRSLWLRGLTEISETGLSWLAERCKKLILVDLTGCNKIRPFSLQSLASEWKFAVYNPMQQDYKGMVPSLRAEDRLFIEEYGDCWRAAVCIQSLYRARVARREAQSRKEQKLMRWVATQLQRMYRGRQARRVAIFRRMQFNLESDAARRIQMCYRRREAKRKALKDLKQRELKRRDQAARCMQAAYRRRRFLGRVQIRTLERLASESRLNEAAIKLQRVWRGRKARAGTNVLRAAKMVRDIEQAEAANKLQNMYRMRAARRETQLKRTERLLQAQREECHVIRVQSHVRRRRAQKQLQRLRDHHQKVHDAARRIQRHWRAKKQRVAAQVMCVALLRKREYDAAVTLQAAWKRKKGREQVGLLRLLQEQQRSIEIAAVLLVQRNWRGKHARNRAARIKQQAMDRIVAQFRLEARCATLVQAHYRGMRGRLQYQVLRHQKKMRWKHIAQPDQQFYYNKETGEVRFRPPQDVLDLLPQPMCDNCVPPDVSISHMECKDCGEMYCNTCWRHVHAGGKRKTHEFRALYDYYGKRIDYGDGEFPSVWPSEILYDEMGGWSLRVYPHRQPEDIHGAWERYVDTESGRVWYYNKETQQSTYEVPSSFATTIPTPFIGQLSGQDWVKYVEDTTAIPYYYNTRTGESTYVRPVEFATPREAQTDVGNSVPGWTKYVDPVSGNVYYYHTVTQESTFVRPPTFVTPRM